MAKGTSGPHLFCLFLRLQTIPYHLSEGLDSQQLNPGFDRASEVICLFLRCGSAFMKINVPHPSHQNLPMPKARCNV